MLHLLGTVVVASLLFAGTSRAQATITVPATASVGEEITIGYSDASKAGQTVTVQIDNGGYPEVVTQEVQIKLDQDGKGSVQWTVPDWIGAAFNAPGAAEQTMAIDE